MWFNVKRYFRMRNCVEPGIPENSPSSRLDYTPNYLTCGITGHGVKAKGPFLKHQRAQLSVKGLQPDHEGSSPGMSPPVLPRELVKLHADLPRKSMCRLTVKRSH